MGSCVADLKGAGTGGAGLDERGAVSTQQQDAATKTVSPQQLPCVFPAAVAGCQTRRNANKMAAIVFNYFFPFFFSASSSFFKNFFGSFLKSFSHDLQQSCTSRPSCLIT